MKKVDWVQEHCFFPQGAHSLKEHGWSLAPIGFGNEVSLRARALERLDKVQGMEEDPVPNKTNKFHGCPGPLL